MSIETELERLIAQLEDRYETWHQKPVKSFKTNQFTFSPTVYSVGKAVSIWYRSDKWEKDGEVYDYTHDFSSRPTVYRPKPKNGQGKDTRALLGVGDLHGIVPLTALAVVKELTVEKNGVTRAIQFARPPKLTATRDMKTLVILSPEPIFIRGGKMVVGAPGIMK